MTEVALRRVEDARAQRRPHHGLGRARRVHDAQRLGRDARAVGRETSQP